jgi:hypothetical protein
MKNSPTRAMVQPSTEQRHKTTVWSRKVRYCVCGLALSFVALITVGVTYVNVHWPYRYRTVQPLLQEILGSQVKIGHYHRVYFPNPGFMATEITLRRDSAPDLPPVGSITSVTVEGTWRDLLMLQKRVRQVDITGLHIVIPPIGSREMREDFPPGSSANFSGPDAVVEQLRIHESTLDIMRADGKRYSFPIRMLTIQNLNKGQALAYSVDMWNPKPTGHIFSTGSFGPLNVQNLGATPLSGDFNFSSVNLHDIGNISGTLSSKGDFQGNLASIQADAASFTPDFAVGVGQHTPFNTAVHCTINGLNGDVVIRGVDAKTAETEIHVRGGIVGSPKVIDVDMAVSDGRAQDVLRPFMHAEVPVAGVIWLHAHAHVDPAKHGTGFLDRLEVDGTFDVPAERLTNRGTEQKLSAFSQRAQGAKPSEPDAGAADRGSANQASSAASSSLSTDVLSSLKGHVRILNGVLSTQQLTFQMPGAAADLSGSFSLRDDSVHLIGNLRMQSDISHATRGFKSVLMKPLIPFFKKDKAGAVIPIAVIGSPGAYKVTQDILHKK